MSWISDFGPLLISVGGLTGISAVLLVPIQVKKIRADSHLSEAEAAAKISAASISFLEPLQGSIAFLNKQLAEANSKVIELSGEVNALRGQVSTMAKDLEVAYDRIHELEGPPDAPRRRKTDLLP